MSLDTPAKRLKWAREHHGQYAKATDAAKAFGWTVSTYLGHENGDRNPSRTAAKRYARAYRVRWEWLLDEDGPAIAGTQEAPIVGLVSGPSEIHLYPKGKVQHTTELPPGGKTSTVAVEVQGGSMRGIADDKWLIFFDDEHRPPSADLVGKLCVLELDAGEILLRVLQPGRKKGRYDLESATEPTIRDAKVKWAARVTWLKPR